MIKGIDDLESMDPKELSLVSILVILSKFNVPTFERNNKTKCPETHMAMYCHKMAKYAHNEELLIHVIQDSLTKVVAKWYLKFRKG